MGETRFCFDSELLQKSGEHIYIFNFGIKNNTIIFFFYVFFYYCIVKCIFVYQSDSNRNQGSDLHCVYVP